jgi:hypothetical protein
MIVPPRPQNVCGVNDEGSYSHNPFDFGAWLRFDAAAVNFSRNPIRIVATAYRLTSAK